MVLLCVLACRLGAQVVYTWSGGDILTGTIVPTGVTTVTGLDTLNIQTTADHDFNGKLVTINGTANWSAGNLRSGGAGSITNNANWNDTATAQLNSAFGGGASFINAATGVYTKSAGVTTFNIGLNNAGTVTVTGGSLNLNAGGAFTNGSVLSSSGSGVFQLLGGTLTMTGNITATNFLFNGGVLAGDQTFTGSTLAWQDGTWNSANTTTLAAGTTLTILSGADHDFQAHTIVNNGTVAWNAGNLRSGSAGAITNNANWNDATTAQINGAYGGGASFTNAAGGTYTKTAGVTNFNIGLTNAGTVNVTGGTLNLNAGGTFTNGAVLSSSGSGVLQLLGGTLTMTGNITATNFLFNGGNLTGDQTFTGSLLNWQDGTWNSANTTTLAGGTTLNIIGAADHDFQGHAIVNNGTVNWSGGNLRSGSAGTITNSGNWNDTTTSQVNAAYGGGATFINAVGGTYTKSAGTTTFNVPFSNSGAVNVTGGTLNLATGGTFYDGSSIGSSGSGVAQLTGGVLTGNGTGVFTATNFLLTGGQLSGNMTFLGTTNWVGSNFNTAGTATIGATGTMDITSAADHDFQGHAIVNNGTVNWLAGNLRSGSNGSITNNATWNDAASAQVNGAYGGGTTFTNAATGVYNKTAGVTTMGSGIFVNEGTVSVTGGQLDLVGGTLSNGSTIGSSGPGLVQLTSGTLTASGTVNVQNFVLAGGTVTGNQTFAGSLTWTGADFNSANTTTISSGSVLTIASAADHNFQSHTLINQGTVNWTAGNLRSGSSGSINNQGTWNDTSSGYQVNSAYGGGTTFVNSGTYTKSTVGSTTTMTVPLTNTGTINVTGGTFALTNSFTNTGMLSLSTGTSLTSTSALTFGAGSLWRGDGAVTASALANSGTINPGDNVSTGLLTMNGNLSLLATSVAAFELGGTTLGSQYDHLTVTGNLGLGGVLAVNVIGSFDTGINNAMTFNLASSSVLTGTFTNAANGARIATTDGRFTFLVNYGAGSSFGVNDVVISGFQGVPEPSTWALLLSGAGYLALAIRRRKRG